MNWWLLWQLIRPLQRMTPVDLAFCIFCSKEVIVVYFAGYAVAGGSRVRLQLQRAQHATDVDAARSIGVDELLESMLRLPSRRQNCFILAVLDCGHFGLNWFVSESVQSRSTAQPFNRTSIKGDCCMVLQPSAKENPNNRYQNNNTSERVLHLYDSIYRLVWHVPATGVCRTPWCC